MILRNLIFCGLAGLAFTACNKDDEGEMELIPADQLVANEWVYVGFSENGVVSEVSDDDCDKDDTIKFASDNSAVYDFNDDTLCDGEADEAPQKGSYVLVGEKLTVATLGLAGEYTIAKLTADDLWLEQKDGDDVSQERYKALK